MKSYRETTPLVRPISDTVNAKALAANVAEADTVPAEAKLVVINATTPIYMKVGGVAAVPTDTTNGSASELMTTFPQLRRVHPGQSISLLWTATSVVTLSYYA